MTYIPFFIRNIITPRINRTIYSYVTWAACRSTIPNICESSRRNLAWDLRLHLSKLCTNVLYTKLEVSITRFVYLVCFLINEHTGLYDSHMIHSMSDDCKLTSATLANLHNRTTVIFCCSCFIKCVFKADMGNHVMWTITISKQLCQCTHYILVVYCVYTMSQ